MINDEYQKSLFDIHHSAIGIPLWKFATSCVAVRAVFSLLATFVDAPFCFAHSNPRDKSRGN